MLDKVQKRFKLWLQAYNAHYGVTRSTYSSISYKSCKSTVDLESAWLAGFIEADGGFYAGLTKQTNYNLQ